MVLSVLFFKKHICNVLLMQEHHLLLLGDIKLVLLFLRGRPPLHLIAAQLLHAPSPGHIDVD